MNQKGGARRSITAIFSSRKREGRKVVSGNRGGDDLRSVEETWRHLGGQQRRRKTLP